MWADLDITATDRVAAPVDEATRTGIAALPRRPAASDRGRPLTLPTIDRATAWALGPAAAAATAFLTEVGRELGAPLGAALGVPVEVERVALGPHLPAAVGARFFLRPAPRMAPVAVDLPAASCALLVAAVTRRPPAPGLFAPDRLGRAVLGYAVLAALEVLSARLGVDLVVLDAAEVPRGPTVEVTARIDGMRAVLFVRGLPAGRLVRPGASRPAPGRLGAMRVPLTLETPPVALAYGCLRALAPGDVLLPSPSLHLSEGRLQGSVRLCSTGAGGLWGVAERERFVVHSHPSTKELPMPPPDPAELRVEVRVLLSSFSATLAELCALEPGGVLPLPATSPMVRLCVGERGIATGELVDIEGALGVRLMTVEEPA